VQHRSGVYAAAPDDAVFKAISSVYADHHPTMRKNSVFQGGITNGAKVRCILFVPLKCEIRAVC
jgi:hypothetical protein